MFRLTAYVNEAVKTYTPQHFSKSMFLKVVLKMFIF